MHNWNNCFLVNMFKMVCVLFGTILILVSEARNSFESIQLTDSSFNNRKQQTNVISSVSNCMCVMYYLCKDGNIITDGSGIIDIRVNQDNPCGSNYLLVCCNPENITRKPVERKSFPQKHERTKCGKRNSQGIGFRITGNVDETEYGEFPWMVAVLRTEIIPGTQIAENMYICGGALIHPEVVLTAAHCIEDQIDKLKIRAGEWDTTAVSELLPHQNRNVDAVIVHPNFHSESLRNDIALLILDKPVVLSENVNIVCLPPNRFVVDNTKCFASGWGKDNFDNEGRYQNILKKVELPLVNRNICEQILRNTRLGLLFKLDRSFVCAGGERGKDTCKGDGGSPLMCPVPGRQDQYFQTGIVAWGIGCGNDIPGVYVNVAFFRDWIDKQLASRNLDVSFYQY